MAGRCSSLATPCPARYQKLAYSCFLNSTFTLSREHAWDRTPNCHRLGPFRWTHLLISRSFHVFEGRVATPGNHIQHQLSASHTVADARILLLLCQAPAKISCCLTAILCMLVQEVKAPAAGQPTCANMVSICHLCHQPIEVAVVHVCMASTLCCQ